MTERVYIPIGETYKVDDNLTVRCVVDFGESIPCFRGGSRVTRCAFSDMDCSKFLCYPSVRKDRELVYFVKVDEE